MKVETGAFPTLPGFEETKAIVEPEATKTIFNEKAMPALGQDEPEFIVKKGGPKGKKRGAPL